MLNNLVIVAKISNNVIQENYNILNKYDILHKTKHYNNKFCHNLFYKAQLFKFRDYYKYIYHTHLLLTNNLHQQEIIEQIFDDLLHVIFNHFHNHTNIATSMFFIKKAIKHACEQLQKITLLSYEKFNDSFTVKKLPQPVVGQFALEIDNAKVVVPIDSNWCYRFAPSRYGIYTLTTESSIRNMFNTYTLNILTPTSNLVKNDVIRNCSEVLRQLLDVTVIPKPQQTFSTVPVTFYIATTESVNKLKKPIIKLTKNDLSKIDIQKSFSYHVPIMHETHHTDYKLFYHSARQVLNTNISHALRKYLCLYGYKCYMSYDNFVNDRCLPSVINSKYHLENKQKYVPIAVGSEPNLTIIIETDYSNINKNNILPKELSSIFYTLTNKQKNIHRNLSVKFLPKETLRLKKLYKTHPSKAITQAFQVRDKQMYKLSKDVLLRFFIKRDYQSKTDFPSIIVNPFQCDSKSFNIPGIKWYILESYNTHISEMCHRILVQNQKKLKIL